jgi:hypothetical protein
VVARWDGTAVTWCEEGTARDSGGDAERKRVHSVVAGREGLGNEEAAVGGGEAEAGGCARLWEVDAWLWEVRARAPCTGVGRA